MSKKNELIKTNTTAMCNTDRLAFYVHSILELDFLLFLRCSNWLTNMKTHFLYEPFLEIFVQRNEIKKKLAIYENKNFS